MNTAEESPLKAPYLREQRNFNAQNKEQMEDVLNESYREIAQKVNEREIGIYGENFYTVTGQKWFLDDEIGPLQTQRRIYRFISSGSIVHQIDLNNIKAIVKIYGTFTNGTNWYPLPFVDISNTINQVSIDIDPTNINITAGAGAPAITEGYVIIEWLAIRN